MRPEPARMLQDFHATINYRFPFPKPRAVRGPQAGSPLGEVDATGSFFICHLTFFICHLCQKAHGEGGLAVLAYAADTRRTNLTNEKCQMTNGKCSYPG